MNAVLKPPPAMRIFRVPAAVRDSRLARAATVSGPAPRRPTEPNADETTNSLLFMMCPVLAQEVGGGAATRRGRRDHPGHGRESVICCRLLPPLDIPQLEDPGGVACRRTTCE